MKQRLLPILILVMYSAILVNVLVFKHLPMIRIGHMMFDFGGTREGVPNFIPFKTILPYLLGESGLLIALLNIAGNIVLLVPVGFMVPFIYRRITLKKMLLIAGASGLAIEGLQALLHVGIFDIDDVILNGLGVILGFWAFNITAKIRFTKPVIITTTATALVVAGAALYGIIAFSNNQPPLRLPYVNNNMQPGSFDTPQAYSKGRQPISAAGNAQNNTTAATQQLPDPCGGTGGTGQIVSVGNNSITIKGHNGADELIKIGTRTKIKNAAGLLTEADLKPGQRVTVVIGLEPGDDRLASAIMVCNQ